MNRPFPSARGLKIHCARWCDPDGPVRSRKGSLADKEVQLAKRKEQAAQLEPVIINDHQIDNVLLFTYLGCMMSGDGYDHRMAIHLSDLFLPRKSFEVWTRVCGVKN